MSTRAPEHTATPPDATRPAPIGPAPLRSDGSPSFGVYAGMPDTFDYSALSGPHGRNRISAFLRHKRWVYVFAATDEVIVIGAIVDAGPTGTAFCMATDRATGEVLADASRPGGLGPLTGVNDRPTDGHRAHYVMPGTLVTVRGDDRELRLRATFHRFPFVPLVREPWIDLDLRLDTEIHPGTTTVAELVDGSPLVSSTAKNAALPTRGQLTVRDKDQTLAFDLSGGLGGFDYTNGFLPRHTEWRRAFLTGLLPEGRSLGLNLVSGFTGLGGRAQENMCWLDGAALTPIATRRKHLNLGAIRSSFLQPTGHFSGSLTVAGERIAVDALPGVVEHQDVLW